MDDECGYNVGVDVDASKMGLLSSTTNLYM